MRDIRLAAVCMRSYFGQIEKNLARTEAFVHDAALNGVSMICFPELSITGYTVVGNPQQYAESIPGPISDRIVHLAREFKLVVTAGMLEKAEGGKPYITQIAAGADGLIGRYRKTHLSPKETGLYEPGEAIRTFTFDYCAFGIQLCYETHFPELSTIMSLQGAEVIFFLYASPHGKPAEKRDSWLRYLPARAFDNGVFVVACNQVGENGAGLSFPGVILITNPSGRIIYRYSGSREKMIVASLRASDLTDARSDTMKYFFPRRRPELYEPLFQ